MYSKSVERANPGCILFLVDQSYSMTDPFAGAPRSKVEAVATAINRFISELIITCEKGEDKPRHYFDVGVIGYTTNQKGEPIIGSLLQGPALAGRDLVSVVDLYDNPLDVEIRQKDDGTGGLVEVRFPIWYRVPPPETMLGTPMCAVLQHCYSVAAGWCAFHPASFPPVVIHLTDGESNDGDPEAAAASLRSLSTQDGNLLLFNCHLSSSLADGVLFPAAEQQLPDDYARLLFRMSSPLPDKLRGNAEAKSIPAAAGARGMAFNADGVKMLLLISVGTMIATPANLR
ncbi:MAG TPA: hypothetical protein VEL76_18900 [Gemmataceae bacterium]|nr:hypothetical protein [Gemmataceae bacterium]